MEECNPQKSFFDKFGMLMPNSGTYLLEMSAHISLKVATKGSFGAKKFRKFSIFQAIILKQKGRSATEKIGVCL